jgi:hypothetical protein
MLTEQRLPHIVDADGSVAGREDTPGIRLPVEEEHRA